MSTRLTLNLLLLLPLTLVGCCCMDRVYNPGCCNHGAEPVSDGCDSCNGGGQHRAGCTPGAQLKKCLTCNSGCGDIYWGEWMSDPPDCCDPCDNCGNWTGQGCCGLGFWDQLCSGAPGLWGWRCGNDGCNSTCGSCGGGHGGCASCGGEGGSDYEVYDHAPAGPVLQPERVRKPAPKPAEPNGVKPEDIEGAKPDQLMPDMPPKPMPMPEGQTTQHRSTGRQPSIHPARSSPYRTPASRNPTSRERSLKCAPNYP